MGSAGGNGLSEDQRPTFRERPTIAQGNEQIDLYFSGPAHTGGDTWVVFPSQRVVHAGDVFALKTFPVIDTNNGGNPSEYSRTISKSTFGTYRNRHGRNRALASASLNGRPAAL